MGIAACRDLVGALALAIAVAAEAQTTIRVPQDQPTIQGAIDAAVNGDTVLVAPGTYVENIDFLGKAITVTSEGGPELTLIDGNQAGPVIKFQSGEARTSILSGFTVFNGRSSLSFPTFGMGGGIWIKNASPSITGNIIANNRGCNGIGIGGENTAPLIQGNTIANNRRDGCTGGTGGGGINITNDATPRPPSEILDNVIYGNVMTSGDGGGIWVGGNVTIRGNIISDNSATGTSPCSRGGGISAAGTATIVQNVIAGNTAGCGGGLHLQNGTGERVLGNTFADNDSPLGSGIYSLITVGLPPTLVNNLVVAKAGQAAVHCVNNNGTAPPIFRSSDVFAPSGTGYGGSCTDQTGSDGNISADPLFVDLEGGNFRLQASSPAINAGGEAALLPLRDLDLNARMLDGAVDIGAYERVALLSPGSHDFGQVQLGASPAATVFTIVNSGAAPLVISSIGIGNRAAGAGGPSDFAVAPGGTVPCPSLAPTLAAGQSCTVSVTFTTPATLGRKGATLSVVSDAGGSPTVAALFAHVTVDTAISSSPPAQTVSGTANFSFATNVEGSTFECSLDAVDFFSCTSPVSLGVTLGSHTFRVRSVSRLGDADPTPASHVWTIVPRARRGDFNGDGRADILWRNAVSGENYLYPMNGTVILGTEGYVRTVADLNWKVAGIGDFDGDGKVDVLWRNTSTGENYLYFMDGTTIKPTEGYLRTVADQNWQVAGIGDFDGDGQADVLWRNTSTGENYLHFMDGTTIKPTEGYLRTVADQNWQVAGIGDFDGDGKDDILWRNSSTGENYLYPMNGLAILPTEGYLRTVSDLNWKISGVGDFDGEFFGTSDILWRNASTGENYLYPMYGTMILGTEGYVRTVADLDWQVKGAGDYDGDGIADILWRHAETGENYLYPLIGTFIKPTEGYLRTVPQPDWQVQ